MKHKSYLFLFTAFIGMLVGAGCTDSPAEPDPQTEVGGPGRYQARVTVVLPSEFSTRATRADEAEYKDGEPQEWKVQNMWFEFFDQFHHRLGFKQPDAPFTFKPDSNNKNVTASATVTIDANVQPKYMLTLINVDHDVISTFENITWNDYNKPYRPYDVVKKEFIPLKTAINRYAANTDKDGGQFLMTSSSYFDESNTPQCAFDLQPSGKQSFIYKESDQAKEHPTAQVYVERVVAKATVSIKPAQDKAEGNYNKEKGFFLINNKTDNEKNSTTTTQFGVKLLGWTLNATNRWIYPIKQLGAWDATNGTWASNSWQSWLNAFDAKVAWNNSTDHRSSWAQSPYYTTEGTTPTDYTKVLENSKFKGHELENGSLNDLSYEYCSLDQTKNEFYDTGTFPNNVEYCLENAFDGKLSSRPGLITHVIIKGQYCNMDGSDYNGNVYMVGKTIYTETELKAHILRIIRDTWDSNVDNEVWWSKMFTKQGEKYVPNADAINKAIRFTRVYTEWKDRADVKLEQIEATDADTDFNAYIKQLMADRNPQGTTTPLTLKQILFPGQTVWVYPQGLCYYSIPIKHFGEAVGSGTEGSATHPTGYYGVVRNHWYTINVSEVKGFGNPASPDKPIVPETINEDNYKVEVNINVLPWRRITNDATIGENDGGWTGTK